MSGGGGLNFARKRNQMVKEQIESRGIKNHRLLEAFRKVPRHLFIEEALQDQAYEDYPLPIGDGQTISQPYMVALMIDALQPTKNEKILEIGTGSGYQTALLAELAEEVYSIERLPSLAHRAISILNRMEYYNVTVKIGDGTFGWPEKAPFEGIIVSAGAPEIPEILKGQLAPGGRLVIPVGNQSIQSLIRVTHTSRGFKTENLGGCTFVKLIGHYGWRNHG